MEAAGARGARKAQGPYASATAAQELFAHLTTTVPSLSTVAMSSRLALYAPTTTNRRVSRAKFRAPRERLTGTVTVLWCAGELSQSEWRWSFVSRNTQHAHAWRRQTCASGGPLPQGPMLRRRRQVRHRPARRPPAEENDFTTMSVTERNRVRTQATRALLSTVGSTFSEPESDPEPSSPASALSLRRHSRNKQSSVPPGWRNSPFQGRS